MKNITAQFGKQVMKTFSPGNRYRPQRQRVKIVNYRFIMVIIQHSFNNLFEIEIIN